MIDNNGTGGLTSPARLPITAAGERQAGSLLVQGSGTTTISGAIDGDIVATLAKAGAGLLTFQGAATYTGATTVSGGTLKVNERRHDSQQQFDCRQRRRRRHVLAGQQLGRATWPIAWGAARA